MLIGQLLHHKLPWEINHDWTFEVVASDGHIIARCQSSGEAQEIIDEAKALEVVVDVDYGPDYGQETGPTSREHADYWDNAYLDCLAQYKQCQKDLATAKHADKPALALRLGELTEQLDALASVVRSM